VNLIETVAATRGHFRYESGHHGDLWLDLDSLFTDPRRMASWASSLAAKAEASRPESVCGPLIGGAFVAQLVAVELGIDFAWLEHLMKVNGGADYRIPQGLRARVRGKRILVVDDAVNAGHALRAALRDLDECGGAPAALAALLSLGDAGPELARERGIPWFALGSIERRMWPPESCPLCDSGVPLVDPGAGE
jgi:orotate phosphoribosyltransferase